MIDPTCDHEWCYPPNLIDNDSKIDAKDIPEAIRTCLQCGVKQRILGVNDKREIIWQTALQKPPPCKEHIHKDGAKFCSRCGAKLPKEKRQTWQSRREDEVRNFVFRRELDRRSNAREDVYILMIIVLCVISLGIMCI